MKAETNRFWNAVTIAGLFTLMMWLVFGLEQLFDLNLRFMGILPRRIEGLLGILTTPFVHSGFQHLFNNSSAIFVLLGTIYFFYHKAFWRSVIWIHLATGIWVWVLARNSVHIGASGLVYGYASFLFFSGIFRRDLQAQVVSFIIIAFYGGMVWGVLPSDPTISWESHLMGALAGAVVAYSVRKIGVMPRKRYSWENEPDEEPRDNFAVWNYRKGYFPPREHEEQEDVGDEL